MLHASRVTAGRTAVAFFNMKHFQIKKRYSLSPQNLHEGFSKLLRPNDRLLRHANSGGGGPRVLVLDQQQRVKGVYLPMFCMPHPGSLTAGSSALGITVEHFLRCVQATAPSLDAKDAAAAVMPTVMLLLSHSHGVAYSVMRADGTMAVPVKNLAVDPILSEMTDTSDATSPSAVVMRNAAFGTASPLTRTSPGTAASCRIIREELNSEEHGAKLSACSTFFWVTQSNQSCITHDMARNAEYYWERVATEEVAGETVPSGAIKFTDRRWVSVLEASLRVKGGQKIYTRDPVSGDYVVDASGLVAASTHGVLLLNHDPRSDFPCAP